jgi:ketosteroid isomerase-like protein
MNHGEGVRLGEGWIADWNRHDLDAVMARLHDDVVFSSPLIPQVVGEPSGVLRGKDAVRAYWEQALTMLPDLHFELLGITVGHDALAVRYVNERGRESTEVLLVDLDGLVVRGAGTYGEAPRLA